MQVIILVTANSDLLFRLEFTLSEQDRQSSYSRYKVEWIKLSLCRIIGLNEHLKVPVPLVVYTLPYSYAFNLFICSIT